MKLYLTRHTRTNYNDLELCNADPSVDVHLTGRGLEQAQELADKLRNADFERIIISTLPRTKQTADIINQYHHASIEVDKRISDNLTGYESRPYTEYNGDRLAAPDYWAFKGPGGESLNDVMVRVKAFLDDLRNRTDVESVLVVTHQCIAQLMVGAIQGLSKAETQIIEVNHGEYRVLEI